jgi:hypothetical protein
LAAAISAAWFNRTKALEMKKSTRKLNLNTQTMRLLTPDALEKVHGGYKQPPETHTCVCPNDPPPSYFECPISQWCDL